MVQGKTVSVIVLLTSLLISIFSLVYVYCFLELNINDWIALVSLLLLGWIFMLSGLGEILKVLRQSKLKIVRSYVEVKNEGTKGEFKDVYCVIENVGSEKATDCEIEVTVENHNSYCLRGSHFDLKPDKKEPIRFQQIVKSTGKTSDTSEKSPTLSIGHVYECEVTFYGKNFRKKTHHLKLDLSSWEKVGIILD